MKLLTVIGARPQFIKAATVSRAFREHHLSVHEVLLHTGQHYDSNMSEVFFKQLGLPEPDIEVETAEPQGAAARTTRKLSSAS